jgi:hypothetical protein
MKHASSNPGYFSSSSWPGLHGQDGWNWGATATSLPVTAGLIEISEMQRGRIDHAIAVALPDACAGWFAWPAQRTDGESTDPWCIPEGAKLRLDPSVDVQALRLPPITAMVARAAQRYGLIVRDRTAGSFAFYAESPKPAQVRFYGGKAPIWGGEPPSRALDRFPWSALQVLRTHACTRAPCQMPPRGTSQRH